MNDEIMQAIAEIAKQREILSEVRARLIIETLLRNMDSKDLMDVGIRAISLVKKRT